MTLQKVRRVLDTRDEEVQLTVVLMVTKHRSVLLLQAAPGEVLSGGRNLPPANTTDFGVSGATSDVPGPYAWNARARRTACATMFCAQ